VTYITAIDRETAYDRFSRRHPLVALLFGAVVFLPFMVGIVVGGCLLVVGVCLAAHTADSKLVGARQGSISHNNSPSNDQY
jgi:hypothetical protein